MRLCGLSSALVGDQTLWDFDDGLDVFTRAVRITAAPVRVIWPHDIKHARRNPHAYAFSAEQPEIPFGIIGRRLPHRLPVGPVQLFAAIENYLNVQIALMRLEGAVWPDGHPLLDDVIAAVQRIAAWILLLEAHHLGDRL